MVRTRFADEYLVAGGVAPSDVRPVLPRVDASRVLVKVAPRWFAALWFRNIVAIALPWAVYLRPGYAAELPGRNPRDVARLIAHELTHIEQWRRLGAVRHLVQYVGDYVQARIRGASHDAAYRAIRLEVEARAAARLIVGGPA